MARRFVFACLSALIALGACADQQNPALPISGDAGPDAAAPDAHPPSKVSGDPSLGMLLAGTILGESGPFDGQVLVSPDGVIACAEPGDACSKDPKAAGIARSEVDIVAPGLIDTHNHILFDIFDDSDWLPTKTYQNHNDWTKATNEPRYPIMVDVKQCLEDASQGKPTWCPSKYDGAGNLRCEMEKWGELKGMVAGTTSIVGLAGTAFPCFASLARSVDTPYNGLPSDKVQTSALFPPSKTTADGVCSNYAADKTDAFLIHCGEGIDQRSRDELATLGTVTTTPECLYAPGTAVTHGTAFTVTEFATMKSKDMKLIWSPASNVALYGETTNIPAALDAGLTVALAPDWSMGGSQNLLDELRFAKKWSDTKWAGRLTAKDLVAMATVQAAKVLALEGVIGTIKAGLQADLFVVRGDKSAPYDAILAATPKEVELTVVGGKVLYGDEALLGFSRSPAACEGFDACGEKKFVCVAVPGETKDKLSQTYAEIKASVETAMTDIDAVTGSAPFAPIAPIVACK